MATPSTSAPTPLVKLTPVQESALVDQLQGDLRELLEAAKEVDEVLSKVNILTEEAGMSSDPGGHLSISRDELAAKYLDVDEKLETTINLQGSCTRQLSSLIKNHRSKRTSCTYHHKCAGERDVHVVQVAAGEGKKVKTFNHPALLPVWRGQGHPPPLCGAIPSERGYVASKGDLVVACDAREGMVDHMWILAVVVSYSPSSRMYTVEDADAGDDLEPFAQRRPFQVAYNKAVPLSLTIPEEWDTSTEYARGSQVYAMFPNTTVFYQAQVYSTPHRRKAFNDYLLSFALDDVPRRRISPRFVIHLPEDL